MDVQKYLSGFFSGTKDPSLDAMQFFMKEYDNFNSKMNFIHIAGTNGKGSCTEMLTKILINSGYKVGKFISPHLIKYNERISINNEDISDLEMEELIIELKVKIDKYNNSHNTKITLEIKSISIFFKSILISILIRCNEMEKSLIASGWNK